MTKALYASHVRQGGLTYLENSSSNTLNTGILNSPYILGQF